MLSRLFHLTYLLITMLPLTACNSAGPTDKALQQLGVLRVAVAKSDHIYYSHDQVSGFEYDLIQKYAEYLGVELQATYVDSPQEAQELVRSRRAHLGLGMFPVTNSTDGLAFGPTLATTDYLVIARPEVKNITSEEDLKDLSIVVADRDLVRDPFSSAQPKNFDVVTLANASSKTLLSMLQENAFDAAIISEADFTLIKRNFPQLENRFTLRNAVPLAWVVATPVSTALEQSLANFFSKQTENDYLAKRWRFHYDYLDGFDFVDARKFLRKYKNALPAFRSEFEQAALEYNYDWRLIAALSYQESHWDPEARSPTGVRGLMMLTKNTADELGVSRLDPGQSIQGGTQYLATLQSRIEETVKQEDRSYFALAAYNLGYGHLRDAQRATRTLNEDPTEWTIIKAHLPLVAKNRNSKTRYGRARGVQAVRYVEGVRKYYAMLRLLEPVTWHSPAAPQKSRLNVNTTMLF